MGVMPDCLIREMALDPKYQMITPFSERVSDEKTISYGLQPAGYDARLDPDIQVIDWARTAGEILDPLDLNTDMYFPGLANPFFVLPPNGFIVGKTVERFKVPRGYVVRGASKTIYSSVGVNFDVASIHPGWEGHLKLHISNTTKVPVKIYGGMGIVYLEFHEIDGRVERDYTQIQGTRFQCHGDKKEG